MKLKTQQSFNLKMVLLSFRVYEQLVNLMMFQHFKCAWLIGNLSARNLKFTLGHASPENSIRKIINAYLVCSQNIFLSHQLNPITANRALNLVCQGRNNIGSKKGYWLPRKHTIEHYKCPNE